MQFLWKVQLHLRIYRSLIVIPLPHPALKHTILSTGGSSFGGFYTGGEGLTHIGHSLRYGFPIASNPVAHT